MRYAEFIDASAAYIVSEALERLFRKDAEFREYLAKHAQPKPGDHRKDEEGPTTGFDSLSKQTGVLRQGYGTKYVTRYTAHPASAVSN